LCSLHYKRSMSDMFTERLSSDKLFQQFVFSMSVETVRRVDSVLEVILLRSGPLYLSGFALTIC